MRERLTFTSGGEVCAAYLYRPEGVANAPCVVMANGVSGTMDWILPDFAERFAANGIAAFTFDYRYLGESGGSPRQLIDVTQQRNDLRAAITYARTIPSIDTQRIALWGTSLGGSHVVTVAAEDPAIRAVVATVPALDAVKGARLGDKMRKSQASLLTTIIGTIKLLAAALSDTIRGALGMEPRYIAVYGKPGESLFSDPELAERFATVEEKSPTWENRVTARLVLHLPRYVTGTIGRITAPILFSLAERDVDIAAEFLQEKARESEHAEVKLYPADHFDMYHGEIFEQVAADQAAFMQQHLT